MLHQLLASRLVCSYEALSHTVSNNFESLFFSCFLFVLLFIPPPPLQRIPKSVVALKSDLFFFTVRDLFGICLVMHDKRAGRQSKEGWMDFCVSHPCGPKDGLRHPEVVPTPCRSTVRRGSINRQMLANFLWNLRAAEILCNYFFNVA